MAQIEQNYETKATAPVDMKPPRKRPGSRKKTKFTLISPKGNQYSVEEDKLDFFKHVHRVDDTWSIK